MQGLILRLSALDAAAENAVRVISFFDELMARRVDIDTLVREASRLAECPVGIVENGGEAAADTAVRRLPDGTAVWLGRSAPGLPLDEIVLERLAIATAVLLDHRSVPPTGLGDAALVELSLSAAAGEAERSRALRLLGLGPREQVTVLAIAAAPDAVARIAATVRGHVAELGSLHAVLVPHSVRAVDEPGALAGIGPTVAGVEAPTAWRRARTALRFAGSWRRIVRWSDLGALAVLAERLRPEDIAEVPDVAALDRIAEEPNGNQTLEVLTAFCATHSVRKAAAALHRHHSTAAAWIAHAEHRLRFPLTSPEGRLRLDLALVLRHLRDSQR